MQACKTFKHKATESHHLSGLWLSYSSLSGTKAKDEYQKLFLQTVAEKDGYVQFFVANETTKPVYFDDVSGLVRRPRVIQQAHYYPFGLPMAKITTLGNPEYAYFFTGKELYEDEALEWYDYGARMYDVQIGRWTTTDPEWQDASPYVFCGNNGVNFTDPDGRKYLIAGFEGTRLDKWMAKNEQAILMTSAITLSITAGILTGGTAGIVLGGAISGGFSGLAVGDAVGATDNEKIGFFLGGAAIGALASWAGTGVAQKIGTSTKSLLPGLIARTFGGATSASINNAGMTILGHLKDEEFDFAGVMYSAVVEQGVYRGGVTGGLGGFAGSVALGGGFGAFVGGFTSSYVGSRMYGASQRGALESGISSGAISYGAYHASQYASFKDLKNQGHNITRRQFNAMSRAAQRTFITGKEWGSTLRGNGTADPLIIGGSDGVKLSKPEVEDIGNFHGHPGISGYVREFATDIGIDNNDAFKPSFVIGRSSYYYHSFGAPSFTNIGSNEIFNPYNPFLFNYGFRP